MADRSSITDSQQLGSQLNEHKKKISCPTTENPVGAGYCQADLASQITDEIRMDKLTLKTIKEDVLATTTEVSSQVEGAAGAGGHCYVPPFRRSGCAAAGRSGCAAVGRSGKTVVMRRSENEEYTIRVDNLCKDIQDCEIRDLFQPFGYITSIFLPRDRHTGASKGLAFVSFDRKEDARKAVVTVSGRRYANLILSIQWAKPSGN